MKYFAYGSNMNTKRLRERVPSAAKLSTGALNNFTLRFHKRSTDGSAKCDAFYTNNKSDEVRGVIYEIDESEKCSLDDAEGLGKGYNQITIRVKSENEILETFTYVADQTEIDETLNPYSWYKDLVISGAREHYLPESYVRKLELIKPIADPDKNREARHLKLLS